MRTVKSVLALITGGVMMALVAWKLPLIDIFETFLVIVAAPLFFLAGAGIVSWGLYNSIVGLPKEFRDRVQEQLDAIQASMNLDEDNDSDEKLSALPD